MFRFLLVSTAVFGVASQLAAASAKFPYEAIVVGDDVHVRSGPGKNYYATSRLQKDDRVTVHRHDPGGWFMIAPPPGSFSWIEASQVERTGNRGVVSIQGDEGQAAQAMVRIGSRLSDDHAYTGRQLQSGDEVEILGEQTLTTEGHKVEMLKILPPAREYRWVKGDFIVPVDAAMRKQIDSDPFATPSAHRAVEQASATVLEAGEKLEEPGKLSAPDLPKVAEASDAGSSPRSTLTEIDNRYADMMTLDISQWQLDDLRLSYKMLRDEQPGLARQIDVRLKALESRQKIYDEYAKFAAIVTATNQRDAQIQTMTGLVVPASGEIPAVELGQPGALPAEGAVSAIPLTAVQPQFDGAGIVQSTNARTPGTPRYMLTAPDGRFLAFLESREVNLDQYLGQSLGLNGKRAKDARLQTDLIQVQRVTPVQLAR